MFINCKACAALRLPEAERPERFRGVRAAVVLVFEDTGDRIGLCAVCADQWDQARARFATHRREWPEEARRPELN